MKISLVKAGIDEVKADIVLIGVFEGQYTLMKKLVKESNSIIKKKIFTGEFLQTYSTSSDKIKADRLLLVGLGKKGEFDLEKLRKAVGVPAKALQAKKYKHIAVAEIPVGKGERPTIWPGGRPSFSISTDRVRPTQPTWNSVWCSVSSACKRARRSAFSCSGTCSAVAAGVPGRGEYLKE